ncbi:lysozyme inhibitor LprI family protein [Verrucomicrobiota bacterium sgz303538]
MLEDHQRAARMSNEGKATWHNFVRSRFVGQRSDRNGTTSVTIDIQSVSLESSSHAELQGLLEYSADSALPVVFEFIGTLDLETREVLIDNHENNPERRYSGRFSENGRVLELRSREPGKAQAKQLHLIHEATISELFSDAPKMRTVAPGNLLEIADKIQERGSAKATGLTFFKKWIGLLLLIQGLVYSTAVAVPWPEGHVVVEGSESPDGRYGVLIPTAEVAPDDDTDAVNYLADLKAHKNLGMIDGSNYFQRQNHRSLSVYWSADSKWCVVKYEARFGFASVAVLEVGPNHFAQVDIGGSIQKQLNAAVVKCTGDSDSRGDASAYFRLSADRKVRVRAVGSTNPKRFEDQKTCCALFQGTFDLTTRKWSVTDARSISETECDDSYEVYGSQDGVSFSTEDGKAEWLDKKMNVIYKFLRSILTPERFSEVKKEQLAWLKKRDAAASTAEKCRLLEVRIKALQDFAW